MQLVLGAFIIGLDSLMAEDKNKIGRPTDYDPKFIDEVDKYLKANQDKEVEVVKQRNDDKGYEMLEHKLKVKLPTREGFALFIGVQRQAIWEWSKKYDGFNYALRKIDTEQQKRLINAGLSGEYNSTIAKLILSSNHGMKERTDTDITSGGEKVGSFNYITPNESNDNSDSETGQGVEDI